MTGPVSESSEVLVRLAVADEVIDLRHRVLRAGLPRESASFPNDALSDAFHVAAFDRNRCVCCASLHPGQWEAAPAWQLRGMATDDAFRGRGIGRRVVAAAERFIAMHPMVDAGVVRLMWANARLIAIPFYTSLGWAIVSERFDVPTAGPHHKIVKRLPNDAIADAADRLQVRHSEIGRGVFATAPVEACTLLLRYTGPVLRYAQTTPLTLAVQVGPDAYIGESGHLDDFVNHSCDPNAGLLVRSESDVTLISLREIAFGEQITFDYSTTMDEDDFEFDCACGSPHCRRRVRDFKHLSVDRRRAYAAFGVVPAYNRRYVPRAT